MRKQAEHALEVCHDEHELFESVECGNTPYEAITKAGLKDEYNLWIYINIK